MTKLVGEHPWVRPEITIEELKKKANSMVSRTNNYEWSDSVEGLPMRFTQSWVITKILAMSGPIKVEGHVSDLEELLKRFNRALVIDKLEQ